jgi:protein involved in polysaccharide export with SLBB domain
MDSYEVMFDSNKNRADSVAIMRAVNNSGIYPMIIQVDNAKGSVIFHFENKLTRRDKERIDEIVKKTLQEVVDIGYS